MPIMLFNIVFAILFFAWIVTIVYAFVKKETLPMIITLVILNAISLLISFTTK